MARTTALHQIILGLVALSLVSSPAVVFAQSTNAPVTITVDAAANRHSISPLIYGVCFGSPEQLKSLNFTVDRYGGDAATRWNWTNNTWNSGNDWYFEAAPAKDLTQSALVDGIVSGDKSAHVDSMVTVPMIGWVAKVSSPTKTLYSFPVSKYGPQQKTDPNIPDAGNGVRPDGTRITTADPNTANVPNTVDFQQQFVRRLIKKFGDSDHGGVRFYLMDNEPGIWQEGHRDVHPNGPTSKEIADDIITYASMVKSLDPDAKIVAPEEWGWGGFVYSGADKQTNEENNWPKDTPDRLSRGGMDNMPWILQYIYNHDVLTGSRTIDYFTCHIYPQGGDSGSDLSEKTELLRNRDTRQLWDRTYADESWIKVPVMLIPRLKDAVSTYYPGTKIGITEYNWGAENSINGATAQADILGIFGREGVDLATRWTTPDGTSPVFKAMQLYRNYDGKRSTFGDTSISDTVPSPDNLSSFAAIRRSDRSLTIMVINKDLTGTTPLTVTLQHVRSGASAQIWQLTSANSITQIDPVAVTDSKLQTMLPAQSITLFIIPAKK